MYFLPETHLLCSEVHCHKLAKMEMLQSKGSQILNIAAKRDIILRNKRVRDI